MEKQYQTFVLNKSKVENNTFLIWDSEGNPPSGKWTALLWRTYDDKDTSTYSVPRIVEEHDNLLRNRYLEWIYDLGISHIGKKRVIDHLELRSGFSYWWMTLIAEKDIVYKSFQITDTIKLLALEYLVANNLVSSIILKSNNKKLIQTFSIWCKNAGLKFKWQLLKTKKESNTWISKLYHSLPYIIQAVIWLGKYIGERWNLRNSYQNGKNFGAITIIDYLFHLNQKSFTDGKFVSNYWTDLVNVLDYHDIRINWLHHYVQHEAVQSTNQAKKLIERFNQNGNEQHTHSCIDRSLSIFVLLAVMFDYIRLSFMSFKLAAIKHKFRPSGSNLNFWPLFKHDWYNSMKGSIAMWNCICLNLFSQIFRHLPYQKNGVYLQENQAWEIAMIYGWREAGHGPLIGVPHTTIRYWDLRYFFNSKNYVHTEKNYLPLPDRIALNGAAALDAYYDMENLKDRIIEVEALRYLYLSDMIPSHKDSSKLQDGPLHILVLGDYFIEVTKRQMKLLEEAALLLPPDISFTVKPHPACRIDANDYPLMQLHITNMPLAQLLTNCNAVYTSNITSAAVDAYYCGIPVITMLDGSTLNMSPLRGREGIEYVSNPAELANAIQNACRCKQITLKPYFCLDKSLSRWQKLLTLFDKMEIRES